MWTAFWVGRVAHERSGKKGFTQRAALSHATFPIPPHVADAHGCRRAPVVVMLEVRELIWLVYIARVLSHLSFVLERPGVDHLFEGFRAFISVAHTQRQAAARGWPVFPLRKTRDVGWRWGAPQEGVKEANRLKVTLGWNLHLVPGGPGTPPASQSPSRSPSPFPVPQPTSSAFYIFSKTL